MSVKADLLAARALIEQGWCQIAGAKDASGKRVDPNHESAVEFCSVGALARVCGPGGDRYFAAVRALADVVEGNRVITFNDTPGRWKDEVVAAFSTAIAQGNQIMAFNDTPECSKDEVLDAFSTAAKDAD